MQPNDLSYMLLLLPYEKYKQRKNCISHLQPATFELVILLVPPCLDERVQTRIHLLVHLQ